MVTVLLVGFAAVGRRRLGGAAAAVAALQAGAWRPRGARLAFQTAPLAWWRGADLVRAAAQGADAAILLCDSRAGETLEIAAAAQNRADAARLDADGYRWAGARLAPGGPERLAGGLSPVGLVRALAHAGYAAEIVQNPDAFVPNRCLYDLARAGGPPAALVFTPGPDCLDPERLEEAVKAAVLFAAAAAEARAPGASAAGAA